MADPLQPREAVRRMAPYSPPSGGREGKLRLDFNENTVGCSPKVIELLHEKLTAKLYKPGAFGKGSNVKLAYRVVDYTAGDASRWSFGSVTATQSTPCNCPR